MGRRKKSNDPVERLFLPENTTKESCAMTRDFAHEQLSNDVLTKWNLQHKKLFMCVLEQVDWTHSGNKNVIELNNRDVAKKMGWNYSPKYERSIAQEIEKLIDFMWRNGEIKMQDPYNHKWLRDHVISSAGGDTNYTYIAISPFFMNHFEGMYHLNQSFPTILSTDVYSFRYSVSYDMYLELRTNGKTGGFENKMEFTMTQLRDILKVAPDSYMKKVIDPETGEARKKYDRTNFIKKAFVPVLEDINNSETIDIIPAKDGKLYDTIREGGKVSKYVIKYKIHTLKQIENSRKKKCNKDADEISIEMIDA